MKASSSRPAERRTVVLHAATRVLSNRGLRGLTHRAVDREAGLPQGTTSYHASTRQALLELVVEQLMAEAEVHIEAAATISNLTEQLDESPSVDELLDPISHVIDMLSSRVDEMRARYALLAELEPSKLRDSLTEDSFARQELLPAFTKTFIKIGLDDPEQQAKDLVAIGDALIWQRTIMGTTTDIKAILRRYLDGMLRA